MRGEVCVAGWRGADRGGVRGRGRLPLVHRHRQMGRRPAHRHGGTAWVSTPVGDRPTDALRSGFPPRIAAKILGHVDLGITDRPNLTNLRNQAKSLLAAWRAGDELALTQVREHSLADAQLVVARGFASWARLVRHLRLTPNAQAGYAMDRLFQATLGPAGEPSSVGQVLDRRVEVLWRTHLDDRPAASGTVRGLPRRPRSRRPGRACRARRRRGGRPSPDDR
jgi:hypothetical protein